MEEKIFVIPNADKESWHEHYKKDGSDNFLMFTHPFRMLLSGGVNSGKTNLIYNILLRQEHKPFERIIICHVDGKFTKEYDLIDHDQVDEIPRPDDTEYFTGAKKTCFIIEDMDYKMMNQQQRSNLNRLFGFVSTHKNVSVIATTQTFFNVPPSVRRMTNVFCIWGNDSDRDYMKTFARKVGEKQTTIMAILDSFESTKDFLLIDMTGRPRRNGIKTKLRVNGTEVVEIET